jgi:hypothetical protein
MDEKQLQFLYNEYAKNKGFKDYSEFKGLMSSEGSRKLFFDDSNKELGFKDYNEFNDLLGLKKKDQVSLSVSSPTQSLSPDFEKGKAFAEKGFLMPSEGTKNTKEPVEKQGWLLNTISSLDKGFAKNFISSPIKGLGTVLQGTTKKVLGGSGEGAISNALIKYGDYLNNAIDELTPQDEEFKGTLTDQVAQAFGQVGSLVATGVLSGAGKAATAALVSEAPKGAIATAVKTLGSELSKPTAISAGLSMGQSEFDRAKEFGATDDQAFEAFYKNAAVGSVLETIPVMQFFKRFNNSTGGSVANYIKTKGVAGLTGGIEEMTTEVMQQLYANKTAKDIYNINQSILDGVGTSGGVGFGVGFLLNAMGANAKILRKQGKQQEAAVLENQVKEYEDNIENPKITSGNKISINDIITQGPQMGIQKAIENLDRDLGNNVITQEQHQEGIIFAEKAAQVADKIPETVMGESRVKSIELLVERNDIKQANQDLLQQKQFADEAYHAGIDEEIKINEERIKKIDSEIYNIAKNPIEEIKITDIKTDENISNVMPYIIEDRNIVEPVIQKIQKNELVNEEDLYNAAQVLENLQSKTNNESLKNLINPLIDKILTYENQSKTEVSTITEKGAVTRVGTDVGKKTVSKALGQFEGSRATITDKNGNTVSGNLKLEDGSYSLYNDQGDKITSIGEKQITDRDVVLPSTDVVPNPITLDENGNIKSITLQLQKVNKEIGILPDRLITIDFKDADKALDYAIQLRAEQVGEFSDPEFEEIITQVEQEIPISKNKQNENIQDKGKPTKQLVEAAEQRVEQKRKEESDRDAAKRKEVKETLINLRNEGVLVTADKSILGKLKKAIGIKQAPMTDAEIDAQMSLLDAMAKVWKQTTRLDNFYDTFIADIKKGDVKAFKNKGGVLFQNIENPIAPVSRVTLAMFQEMPQFQKMIGQMVNPQSIADLIKSNGKQIEKDIITDVLNFEKYKGLKRISFNEFRDDVETQIMKLEKIITDSYASYGKDNLGDQVSYGSTETIIFNSPINHGETGHFSGDFKNRNIQRRNWELKQIPGTDTWVAMDKDMPSGISQDQIQSYIGTAGTQENVQNWISQREKPAMQGDINKGLFGHIRNWFNKSTGIWTIAELQSDVYQKMKADKLLIQAIPKEEIDEYMNKNFWNNYNKDFTNKFVKNLNLKIIPSRDIPNLQIENTEEMGKYERALETVKNNREFNKITKELERLEIIRLGYRSAMNNTFKTNFIINDGVAVFDKEGTYLTTREFSDSPKPGISYGEYETYEAIKEAAAKIGNNFRMGKFGEDRYYVNISGTDNLIEFDSIEKREEYIKDMYGVNPNEYFEEMKNIYNAETDKFKTEEQKYIQKRLEEQKAKFTSIEKQFVASQKFHELRLLREGFKNAAEEGAEVVRFPTPYTLAVIEGYVNKEGENGAPYEIISGDRDRLDFGDEISIDGNTYYVLESTQYRIYVAPQDSTYMYDIDSFKYDETNNRISEIEYEAKRHFNDMDNITLEEIESYEPDEYMGEIAKKLLKEKFEEREEFISEDVSEEDFEEVTISWDDIEKKLDDRVYDEYDDMDLDDLFGGFGEVYSEGNQVLVVEGRGQIENFNQPNEYEATTNEDDYESYLSDEQKTVVNKYKELNKIFQKLRKDSRFVRDDNNMEWIETTMTDEDKQNPIIAFQQEGGDIKGAIDFINDNKASVYVFDGADISTLAHEFTGHLGRRFLEKLAETNDAFRKDYESVMKWAEVKDEIWTTRAEEKFARAFERYLREGKAPTKSLTAIFENLKKWLTQIYNTIKGSSIDIELTQEVRDVFGGLLGAKAEGTLAEVYENIPKESKLSTKNAVKTLINDNFEEIKKQLENKKIC